MGGVLDGIRVLDFGRFVAGPYCATILADFGADVIRIERRGGGEDRTIVPVTPYGEGSLFLQINRNKRSLTYDPRHPEAAEIRRRLIAGADVVVVNVPSTALPAMGLDYKSLCAIRPDIILANVSSFGTSGPWQDRGGFDSVGQAMCGSTYLSGEEGRPFRTPITWVDHAAGLYAAIGIAMALIERGRSGRGQQVDASLLGSAMAFSSTYLIEQALTGIGRTAIGNRSFVNGPTDLFATQDGWIVTQVVGDPLYRRWVKLIGEPAWLDDPRFANDALRGLNGAILSERMARWCGERTNAEALDALAAAAIPAGPVLSPQQALEHPQVQGIGLFQDVRYPGLPDRPAPLTKVPVTLSATPADIRTPPPTVGEHNRAILEGLGFSAEEIEKLVETGAV
ncbi:CaiB/BaiF CoA transferase family protein [Flavisphingomonas formosensis]|uniref:CaiB/BaiF CoA transferase family protein n=1 Tax=Flavisphingomonas formosensis TaxID=861534 RepID=UPI0012FAD70E|nr:CoA transferase [Sphingomonas formosensis]